MSKDELLAENASLKAKLASSKKAIAQFSHAVANELQPERLLEASKKVLAASKLVAQLEAQLVEKDAVIASLQEAIRTMFDDVE